MKLRFAGAIVALLAGVPPGFLYGQTSMPGGNSEASGLSAGAGALAGWRIYEVTVSSSYYDYGSTQNSAGGNPASPVAVQGGATVGWSKGGEKSNVQVVYAPSYVQAFNGVSYRSLNQSFSAMANKTWSAKWSFHVSASALDSDLNQLLFFPTQFGSLAATPATFDQLVAALLTGTSANPALGEIAGAPPLVSSPAAAYLYGGRVFSATAAVSLSYAYSTRASYHATLVGMRTQYLNGGSTNTTGPSNVVPKTTGVNAELGWSYSVTPRTSMGIDVNGGRTVSKFQDVYTSQATVSLSRTLSRRWFASGTAGLGYIRTQVSSFAVPRSAQYELGGSVAYKLYTQTFVGSYAHSISDIYGLGANATESSSGGWVWRRPSRSYSIAANFGYTRLVGPAFPNAGSWTGNVNVSKAASRHLMFSVGGAYAQFPRYVMALAPAVSLTGVMASMAWRPSAGLLAGTR